MVVVGVVVVVVVVGLRDLDRTKSDLPACVVLDLNGFLVTSVCSVVEVVVVETGRRLFRGLYLCVEGSTVTCSNISSDVIGDSVIGFLVVVVVLCLGLSFVRSLGFSLVSMKF